MFAPELSLLKYSHYGLQHYEFWNYVWLREMLCGGWISHIFEFFKMKNNAVEQEEIKMIFLKKQLSVSYFNLISI